MNDFRLRKTHVSPVRAPGFVCEEVEPDVMSPVRAHLSLRTYLRAGYCAACGDPLAVHWSYRPACEVMIYAWLGVSRAFDDAVRHLLRHGVPFYEVSFRRPPMQVDRSAMVRLVRSWKGRR